MDSSAPQTPRMTLVAMSMRSLSPSPAFMTPTMPMTSRHRITMSAMPPMPSTRVPETPPSLRQMISDRVSRPVGSATTITAAVPAMPGVDHVALLDGQVDG